jgi:hypothetical protein
VDHAYAVKTLNEFVQAVDEHLAYLVGRSEVWGPAHTPDELTFTEIRARRIENAYKPGLGDYTHHSTPQENWRRARNAAIQAIGRAKSEDEITAFLRPASPTIAADGLHPWAWEPAAPLWAAEARQDAVLAAARTLNRRLQQKLSRHDIGETDLCLQSFNTQEPTAGKPRLWFPGDRTTPTWKARQEGAKYLSAGAFLAIRNVAAHEDGVTWTEHEALEHLAVLSVIARWIEECDVEKAP